SSICSRDWRSSAETGKRSESPHFWHDRREALLPMRDPMETRSCLAVILAAGEGTRMHSSLPKVMHPVGGLPMFGHVLAAGTQAGATRMAVVVGPDASAVRAFVTRLVPQAVVYVQSE